jgi:hypothetical protein
VGHRLTRLAASVFGSLATIVRGKQTLGPELCVPAFRPVCLYRDTSNSFQWKRTWLSGPFRIRPVLYPLCSFRSPRTLLRLPVESDGPIPAQRRNGVEQCPTQLWESRDTQDG